ncbi:MAG: PKD domain-containing protein, partial [Candidatus Schekmanbacteria bacterium]
MIDRLLSRLWIIALVVSVAFIFAGCAAQLTGQLDADKAKLSELAKLRKDYCPEGESLFAQAEALLENATHEIVEEGNHKAKSAEMLAKAEKLMADAEKAYNECKPPKRYHAPVGAISLPAKAYAGDEVTIDGSGSTDADNDPLTYEWDLGDGTTAKGKVVKHTYEKEGTYNVTLKVSDILYDGKPVAKSITIEKRLPEVIVLNEINYHDVNFA